ncbi:bacteriocin [Campylobacter sp.]|uniref:bacteriocin n=1 Tax=Campylobacter sp. TaxID=205 RepID=UPI002A75614A|nr:bacteriocin [Campylobacter sp.]MDY2764444.1 bacteriocin [Campylobacter sp.]
MNKILFSAVILAILVSGAFAVDLLASLTNGKISDNSPGVKVLSLDEAKQVKGEYNLVLDNISNNELIVYIKMSDLKDTENYLKDMFLLYPNIEDVLSRKATKLQKSAFAIEYSKAIAELSTSLNTPFQQGLGYTVKYEQKISNGVKYDLFTYGVATYDSRLNTFHKINSSNVLNNNLIIKQLRDAFKSDLEYRLKYNR